MKRPVVTDGLIDGETYVSYLTEEIVSLVRSLHSPMLEGVFSFQDYQFGHHDEAASLEELQLQAALLLNHHSEFCSETDCTGSHYNRNKGHAAR